jgi:hypothetical protein
MHGNVWEWCADGLRDYSTDSVVDPIGNLRGALRMARGGSWCMEGQALRSAARNGGDRDFHGRSGIKFHDLGFRLAVIPIEAGSLPMSWIPDGRESAAILVNLERALFLQLETAWQWGADNNHPNVAAYPQFAEIRRIGEEIYEHGGFVGMQNALAGAKASAREKRAYLGGYTWIAEKAWEGIGDWLA